MSKGSGKQGGGASLQPPRGTRDFYPEDMRRRSWLFERFREIALRFGFEEVDAPMVEHAELFTRKAGEEIVEQLYHFELHDRHLALRPEFTPSLARLVIARQGALRFPIRWFAIAQNWRYERMTRGRRREHYQWNMDVWGEPGVEAEAELLGAMFAALDGLGLARGQVKVRLNSRGLLEESLRGGVLADRPEVFAPLCVVIDKIDKIGAEAVTDLLCSADGEVRLTSGEAERVIEMLGARSLDEAARFTTPGSQALADLRTLYDLLDAYGIADQVPFDASVVRGLAYYTGVVFEAFDAQGSLRAIAGGGRYDRLAETLGGRPVPAVGFGFGDAVIGELLADEGLWPELGREIQDVVHAFGPEEKTAAIRVATRLREQGRRVELTLGQSKLKRVLGDADKAGAERVFLIGEDERRRGVVTVRDLARQTEHEESLDGGSR
ncbi:MAG: histidine--tRNA ligase [Spirochaetaceae bacterium]|nr:histidine--tRNA ligase [Myxococcales bacterium]MCB9724347.1 histidine--tRNA ligase [Spirochaetaceae bacterium]